MQITVQYTQRNEEQLEIIFETIQFGTVSAVRIQPIVDKR